MSSSRRVVQVFHSDSPLGETARSYKTDANGSIESITQYFMQDGGTINIGDGEGGDCIRYIQNLEFPGYEIALFLAKNPTHIGTVLGSRFFEHPEYGDEAPLLVIAGDRVVCSDFYELPTVNEWAEIKAEARDE